MQLIFSTDINLFFLKIFSWIFFLEKLCCWALWCMCVFPSLTFQKGRRQTLVKCHGGRPAFCDSDGLLGNLQWNELLSPLRWQPDVLEKRKVAPKVDKTELTARATPVTLKHVHAYLWKPTLYELGSVCPAAHITALNVICSVLLTGSWTINGAQPSEALVCACPCAYGWLVSVKTFEVWYI